MCTLSWPAAIDGHCDHITIKRYHTWLALSHVRGQNQYELNHLSSAGRQKVLPYILEKIYTFYQVQC